MKKQAFTAHILSHTHWDRAWYRTFQQTRAALLDRMDDLLRILEEDPSFRCFTLDGQMAMVEDYLALRPDARPRIAALARTGRLLLGPFFVLPDLYIPAGESLLRNLALGFRLASAFGPPMRLGYLPDPFGLPPQLPQVLRGFGVDGLIFSRGVGDEEDRVGMDFWWEAPDGQSQVLCTHQAAGGYCNLFRFGYENPDSVEASADIACKKTLELAEIMGPHAPHGQLLFNQGCDHQPAEPEVPRLIRAVNRLQRRVRLVQGSALSYQRAIRRAIREGRFSPARYRGELRGGRHANLLPGVLSARVDLKLRHAQCEGLLLRWAEPLAALAQSLGAGRDDSSLVAEAWRLLLLCQPHDNICGCSIDAVHDEDHARMAEVEQLAGMILERTLAPLVGEVPGRTPGDYRIWNPHPWPVRTVVALPRIPAGARPAPVEVIRAAGRIPSPGPLHQVTLPPLGYLRLTPRTPPDVTLDSPDPVLRLSDSGALLDNGHLRVSVDRAGRIGLSLGENRLWFSGLAELFDQADAGDTYDYSPLPDETPLRSGQGQARFRVLRRHPLRVELSIEPELRIPRQLGRDRLSRTRPLARLPIRLFLRLDRGSPRLDLELHLHNRMRDHRIQLAFPTPFRTAQVLAGAPFQVLTRPIDLPDGQGWVQPPYGPQPFAGFVAVQEPGKGGLAILAPGLRDYEALRSPEGTRIQLTLLRSVGWLSRDDLLTRRGNAGPPWPVHGALQGGWHRFRLALVPYEGAFAEAGVLRALSEHAFPPVPFPPEARKRETSPLYPSSQGPPAWPAGASFLHLEPDTVELSALCALPKGHLLARLVNLHTEPTHASIKGPFQPQARLLDLQGHPKGKSLPLKAIPLGPAQILTLELIPHSTKLA